MESTIILTLSLDNIGSQELRDTLEVFNTLLYRFGLVRLVEPLSDLCSGGVQ